MKRCPECRRDYYDDTLLYCLDDGNALLEGPASALDGDEPPTAILSEPSAAFDSLNAEGDSTRIFSPAGTAGKRSTEATLRNSIAVLPFVNMSADADNEYFCDGLAEDLLNALAKIEDLKVAARTSAFSFKGKNVNVADIGVALNVKSILEGSVRKSGDRLRITVQLINATDGFHLWSEQYDRRIEDVFDVQNEIALAVVSALKLKLLGSAEVEVLRRHTENPDAYQAYLLGRFLRYTKNDHGGARRAFEEAVRLDPSHAPSWVGLAEGSILAAHYSMVPARAAIAAAKDALATAKDIQGDSAEALYVEGFMAYIEADWATCDRAYTCAIELEPTHPQYLGSYGLILCVRGRIDEARELFERARESDPLSPFPYAITGAGLATAGHIQESLGFCEQALIFEEQNLLGLWASCGSKIALGYFDEGIATAETAVAVSRRGGFFLGLLGWAFAVAGRTEKAESILAELRNRPSDAPSLVSEVWLLSALGETKAAFELLERAETENQAFAYYVGLPGFDGLRGDPRFSDFIRRKELPESYAD